MELKERVNHSKPVRMEGCLYNTGVFCEKAKCERCGWNPVVQKERREATQASLLPPAKHWKAEGV